MCRMADRGIIRQPWLYARWAWLYYSIQHFPHGIESHATQRQFSEVADLIFNSADPNPQEQLVSPIRMKVGRAFGYHCVNCGKQLDSARFSG